jgi:hypothetical protein
MRGISIVFDLILILAGVLALSGIIVAKNPNARQIIDRLVPFQAFVGLGALILGLVLLLKFGPINMFRGITHDAIRAGAALAGVLSGILLGFLFAMPQIAKWIPGDTPAEAKAMEIARKIAPIQALFGIIAVAAGVVGLLDVLGILGAAQNVTGL